MKILKIDDKWSVQYDPENNDKPMVWLRYGDKHSEFVGNNAVMAMFYSALEQADEIERLRKRMADFGISPDEPTRAELIRDVVRGITRI